MQLARDVVFEETYFLPLGFFRFPGFFVSEPPDFKIRNFCPAAGGQTNPVSQSSRTNLANNLCPIIAAAAQSDFRFQLLVEMLAASWVMLKVQTWVEIKYTHTK